MRAFALSLWKPVDWKFYWNKQYPYCYRRTSLAINPGIPKNSHVFEDRMVSSDWVELERGAYKLNAESAAAKNELITLIRVSTCGESAGQY